MAVARTQWLAMCQRAAPVSVRLMLGFSLFQVSILYTAGGPSLCRVLSVPYRSVGGESITATNDRPTPPPPHRWAVMTM